jgi:hypothetical protein
VLHHLKHKAQKPGITSTLGKIERNSGQCGKENRTKNIKNQIKNGRVRNQPFHLANFIELVGTITPLPQFYQSRSHTFWTSYLYHTTSFTGDVGVG